MERLIMIFSEATCKMWTPRILGILRIVVGFLFLQHGTAKWFGMPHVAMFDGMNMMSLIGVAGVLELAGGLLVCLGIFTRVAAFILSGEMAVGYFMVHAPQGLLPILNQGELAVMYCFVLLYFSVAGAGDYSVDAIQRKNTRV